MEVERGTHTTLYSLRMFFSIRTFLVGSVRRNKNQELGQRRLVFRYGSLIEMLNVERFSDNLNKILSEIILSLSLHIHGESL